MSLPKAYVHVLAPRAGALSSFLDDVEASLLKYGLAPEIGRPRSLSEADATEYARTSPLGASESGWLPYLSTDALAAVDVDESGEVHYLGIAGMRVVNRVVSETTGAHPAVVLQTQTYTGTPDGYDVYRYDKTAEAFRQIVSGSHA